MPRKARIGSPAWPDQICLNGLTMDQAQPDKWAPIDEDALSDDRRDLFLRRKHAVLDYLDGASEKELKQLWGMGRSHVYRLIRERCLQTSPDGTLYGWRGLIPHMRIKPWIRQTSPKVSTATGTGSAGCLQWMFSAPENSGLERAFRKKILENPTGLQGTRRPKLKLLTWFYKELREKGMERRGEWPFNTERMGYTTLCRYINKVLDENPRRRILLQGGMDAVKKSRSGDGVDRPTFGLFQRVECDAHKLDTRIIVMVPSPQGGYEPRKIHRLWVIVIIEVATRAALGYYLSMRREVAAEDVLRAVRNALGKWNRRKISFSDFAYSEDAGFPSSLDPVYQGACWDEFSVDGALANVCDRVERRLKEVVDCVILKPQDPNSFSSRRSLDDRPFIETFFRVLAGGSSGLHGLSTSTKSSPEALKGDGNPADKAREFQFQIEYLFELLDVIIANYNATPHGGIGYRSPLNQMNFLRLNKKTTLIRKADPQQVSRLGASRKLCTLKGGENTGRRPYFNFENARYSSEALAHRFDLIGEKLWLTIENEDDARWATVSTQEGIYICNVRAAPPWHNIPHSLYIRKAIRALEVRRLIHLSSSNDGVEELIKFSENQADRKLPVHPAYIELRRILQTYSQSMELDPLINPIAFSDYSSLLLSQDEILDGNNAESNKSNFVSAKNPSKKSNHVKFLEDENNKSTLPTMRNAKTW